MSMSSFDLHIIARMIFIVSLLSLNWLLYGGGLFCVVLINAKFELSLILSVRSLSASQAADKPRLFNWGLLFLGPRYRYFSDI